MFTKHTQLVVFKTPVECHHCGKKTNNSREYKKHMKSANQEEADMIECDQCKFLSYDRNEMEGHMISKGHKKNNEPLAKCPICAEELPQGTKLVEHVNFVHEDHNITNESLDEEIKITQVPVQR